MLLRHYISTIFPYSLLATSTSSSFAVMSLMQLHEARLQLHRCTQYFWRAPRISKYCADLTRLFDHILAGVSCRDFVTVVGILLLLLLLLRLDSRGVLQSPCYAQFCMFWEGEAINLYIYICIYIYMYIKAAAVQMARTSVLHSMGH